MTSSYSFTKRVSLASSVKCCQNCHLTSPYDVNLVISKSNVLQIYLLRSTTFHDRTEDNASQSESYEPHGYENLSRLALIYETMLFGNIEDMASVRLPGHPTDALILCFIDSKISIIEWDLSKHELAIVSMHKFDPQFFLKEGPSQCLTPQQVIVDYEQRCACVLVCDEYLAVIPFVDSPSNPPNSHMNHHRHSSPSHNESPNPDDDYDDELFDQSKILPSPDDSSLFSTQSSLDAISPLSNISDLNMNEWTSILPHLRPSSLSNHSTSSSISISVANTSTPTSASTSSIKKKTHYPSSYLVHLSDYGIKNVRDIQFMYGYYEPAMMILYEPMGTWAGRVAVLHDSYAASIMTLNLQRQQSMLIWSIKELPYNCYRICPLRKPGGACILSSDAILYLDHSSRYRLSLNQFSTAFDHRPFQGIDSNASTSSSNHNHVSSELIQPTWQDSAKFVTELSSLVLALDNAHYTYLGEYTLLLSIESGHFLLLNIVSDGRTVIHLELTALGRSVLASCMCTLSSQYVFVGSKLADSLLIKYWHVDHNNEEEKSCHQEQQQEQEVQQINGDHSIIQSVQIGESQSNSLTQMDQHQPNNSAHFGQYHLGSHPYNNDEDDDAIKRLKHLMETSKVTTTTQKLSKVRWEIKIVESFWCISPLGDYIFEPADSLPSLYETSSTREMDILACTGLDKTGALTRIRRGIRPVILTSSNLPQCHAIWALYSLPNPTKPIIVSEQDQYLSSQPSNQQSNSVQNNSKTRKSSQLKRDQKRLTKKRPSIETNMEGKREELAQGWDQQSTRGWHHNSTHSFNQRSNQHSNQDESQQATHNSTQISTNNSTISFQDPPLDEYHQFVMLAQSDTTLVLESNDQLDLVSDLPPLICEMTLNAGNIFSRTRIVQIHHYFILMLDRMKIVQQVEVPEGHYIVWSDIMDPYIVILLEDGRVMLYYADADTNLINVLQSQWQPKSKMTSCALCQDSSQVLGFNHLTDEAKDFYNLPSDWSGRMSSWMWYGGERQGHHDSGSNYGYENDDNFIFLNDPMESMLYDGGLATNHGRKFSADSCQYHDIDGKITPPYGFWPTRIISQNYLHHPFYLILVLESGAMEIRQLPRGNCVFQCAGLNNGRQRLEHDLNVKSYWNKGQWGVGMTTIMMEEEMEENTNQNNLRDELPIVIEIRIVSIGSQACLPFLIAALDDGNILIYKCYFYEDPLVGDDILPVRFARIPIPTLAYNLNPLNVSSDSSIIDCQPKKQEPFKIVSSQRREWVHARIRPFRQLSSAFSGVIVIGDYPLWLFCERDYIRIHPWSGGEGPISGWSSLNMSQIFQGFIYSTQSGKCKLAQLDTKWNVDCTGGITSVCRIPIRMTPHSIAFDSQERTIAVTVSTRHSTTLAYNMVGEKRDEVCNSTSSTNIDHHGIINISQGLPPIVEERFELRLIDPCSGDTTDVYSLLDEECGILKILPLDYHTHMNRHPRRMNFLVLATAIVRGEDTLCRGRIIIFDIVHAMAESNQPRRPQLNLKCSKERRSPVSSIDSVHGILIASEGRQIYLYQLRSQEGLYPIAFFDAQLSTVSICVFKNYILLGDIHKSIRLLRWMEPLNNLQLLGKDYNKFNVMGTSMLLMGENLVLVTSDDRGNLFLYRYHPDDVKSLNGARLINQGDFHFGSIVKAMLRFQIYPFNHSNQVDKVKSTTSNQKNGGGHSTGGDNKGQSNWNSSTSGSKTKNVHSNSTSIGTKNVQIEDHPSNTYDSPITIGTLMSALDGTLAFMIPISEFIFIILRKLEARLVEQLEHVAGLHPYAFRATRSTYRLTQSHVKSVVDGDLLIKYYSLERTVQDEVAHSIGKGITTEYILDCLAQTCFQTGYI